MERDSTAILVAEISQWAQHSGREPTPDPSNLGTILHLLSEGLGVTDLADLKEGVTAELLLDVCPEELATDEVDGALVTVRAVVDFAAATGRITPETGQILRHEIDNVQSDFADAVRGDEHHLADLLDDLFGGDSANEDSEGEGEEVDLREVFGTDKLPPLRLPSDPELAQAARDSTWLARAKELALWVGDSRAVTEHGELAENDKVSAVRELGIGDLDLPPESELRIRELAQLWELADELEFLELRQTDGGVAEGVDDWPDADDAIALQVWQDALISMVAWSLPSDAERSGQIDLNFASAGSTMLPLFVSREHGVSLTQLSEMIQELSIEKLSSESAEKAWTAWIAEHGDPARVLYGRLAELGAVTINEQEIVRLTPLAQYAMWADIESEIDVPLLPVPEEMTADQLVAVGTSGTDEQLQREWESWRAVRTPESAARDLVATATSGGAAERIISTSLLRELGDAVDDIWRGLLTEPTLRPYAKQALTEIHGHDPELEATEQDLAWVLADLYGEADEEYLPEEIGEALGEAVGPGHEDVFEAMWRLDHPDAHKVLTLIGRHHPDKVVAKAARKAAFKATNR